jgi:hypothetical protein
VQNDAHFLTLYRYVEANALRAGLVERAEDWPWGGLYARRHRGSAMVDPPQGVAGFADVQQIVLAFQGRPYPYADPADCPDVAAWP